MIGKIIRSYQDEGGRATLRKIRQRLQGEGILNQRVKLI